jgi:hypothetical protein
MATRLSKQTPTPWHFVFRQVDGMGRASRPVVRNARGKKIGHRPADATLMAAAPELLELVAALADRVEMMALQIASALELPRAVYPSVLDKARKTLALLACKGVLP